MTGPGLRDRLRPLELVGMAGVLALFTGGIAFAATREWQLSLIFAGIAFIAALLVLAMLALAAGGPEEQTVDRPVLDQHDDRRNGTRDGGPEPGGRGPEAH